MTLVTFLVGLALAWAYWATCGWFVFDGVTVYVLLFVATLSMACVAAIRSMEWRPIAGAAVLVGNFAASHMAWASDNPPLTSASADVLTAAWFILAGTTRWELGVGAVFLLSALSAVGAALGIFPAVRPPVFLAWSYADATSLCGHAANVILGMGAGDAGLAVRDVARRRPLVADLRRGMLARVGLAAPVARHEAED